MMILETRHSISEILSRQPIFRGLGSMDVARLAESALEYRTSKCEVLFQKGALPSGLHMIVAGQVKLFLPSSQGSEKIVRLANPGEIFGEEAVILDKAYPMTAQATRDSILMVIARPALMAVLAENPSLCCDMMTNLASRMHDLIDNMESCTQRSSAQRVAHYLTQLAPQEAESYEVELSANKQTIASHLNLAPETFSRVLSRFAQQGYIEMQGRLIRVSNRDQLRLHAC
jgi:CRP-like cAMP-binding protein